MVACALATLLLGAISSTVLVSDVGISFGTIISVMSGVELLVSAGEPTNAGVCGPACLLRVRAIYDRADAVSDRLGWRLLLQASTCRHPRFR